MVFPLLRHVLWTDVCVITAGCRRHLLQAAPSSHGLSPTGSCLALASACACALLCKHTSHLPHLLLLPASTPAGLFSKELFNSSRAYSLDKWRFGFWHSQYALIEQLAQLWFGLLPYMWYRLLPAVLPPQLAGNEIARSVGFMLVMSLLGLVTNLPWSYYQTCECCPCKLLGLQA